MPNTHSIDLENALDQHLFITDGDQTGLDLVTDFSIECWVKLESYPSDKSMQIVSKWGGVGSRSYLLNYYKPAAATGRIRVIFQDSSGNTTNHSFTIALTPGTWFHIAVTVDISIPEVKIYVNGVAQVVSEDSSNATSIRNSTARFEIGSNNEASPQDFDGKIDEVRVYDDIRTPTEILDNYQKEIPSDTDHLVGYWKVNNNPDDETANENDLTEANNPVYSEDVPFVGVEGPANLKTVNAVAKADIKTINAVDIADVKSINNIT